MSRGTHPNAFLEYFFLLKLKGKAKSWGSMRAYFWNTPSIRKALLAALEASACVLVARVFPPAKLFRFLQKKYKHMALTVLSPR